MAALAIVILPMGLLFLFLGFHLSDPDLDSLWEKRRQTLQNAGITATRTEAWENSVKSTSKAMLILGLAFTATAIGCWLLDDSSPRPTSGAIINGRPLTQAE